MSPLSSAAANHVTSAAASKNITSASDVSTFLVEQATLVDGLSSLSGVMSGLEAETLADGEIVSNEQPLVRDTRSDLLAAIREGMSSFAPFLLLKMLLQKTCFNSL